MQVIKRIFGRLRSKTASQDRFTAPFLGRLVRLDLPKLNVKSLLAVLAVLLLIIPAAPIQAVTYSEVLSDYIDVKFELIEETPVSVTFGVTVTNTGYELEGMPLEILVDGAPVKTITLTEYKKIGYQVKEPVYEKVTKSYTSAYSVYKTADTKELETDLSESKTFVDYGKDGKTVIREGAYDTFDAKTKTWYWTETEQTGEKKVSKTETVKNSLTVKDSLKKQETVMLDIPSKDDAKSGYGEGTLYYTVTLDTGLLKSNDGWGSAGVMTWRLAGKDYFDLENSSWWATNWQYKRRITIDATSIADTLEEFPITVFLDDTNFNFDHCQADGDDFRFLDADANNLAYEIDLSSDFTDDAIFYVNVPEIVGGTNDGYIDMYYGNPTCISGENIHGTWDENFAAVYHMNDNPAGDGILDSTSNANHGTKGAGDAAPTEVDGLVGKAQYWDGTVNKYINLTDIDTTDTTVEYAINIESYTGSDYTFPVAKGRATHSNGSWSSSLRSGYSIFFARRADNTDYRYGEPVTGDTPITGTEYIFADVIKSSDYLKRYRDGVEKRTNDITGVACPYQSNYIVTIGHAYGLDNLNATISEVRISSTARDGGWISFTNSTLRDDVLTVGSETWADIPQAPINLTYKIDKSDVILSWQKGLRADTTVIVRKEGSYPATPTDGVVVYSGVGTSVIDTDASTETNELYYRAWSYNDWGYSIEYAEARKGAIMTELFMVLGLTAFALWRKEIWVYIPALFALVFIGMRWAESDLLFGIPFFTLALFMAVRLGWVTIQKARG